MKHNLPYIAITFIIAALFAFSGCGSGKKEPSPESTAEVSYVGILVCFNCHADDKNPSGFVKVFGDSQDSINDGIGWFNSPHGNYETANHDVNPAYEGFANETCQTCHDKQGDGELIENFYLDTGNDALGAVSRPIISCESCHGAGGNHFGLGPIPYETPDEERCGQCHSSDSPAGHVTDFAEGDDIIENYQSSPHNTSINENNYVEGSVTDVRARCSRCHADEGARRYIRLVNGTEAYEDLRTAMDGKSDIADASKVQCRTCHDAHNPLRLLGDMATGLPAAWSGEFKACTACHQLIEADYTLNEEAYHNPLVNQYGELEEIITDTHYDDPSTTNIEGYIINAEISHDASAGNSNGGTCRDCHNPHNADNTINNQWARSAHGGRIGETINSVTARAEVTEETGAAWVHYNFKAGNRQSCQRCHTSTGYRNYANSPTTYNQANNVFTATGEQREMLYCWACHTSNKGDLRNPGAINATYADAPHQYPDLAGSNICMACHTGRQSGESIKNSSSDFSNKSFVNSHYLTAGGTIFTTTGYEFDGLSYENVSYYAHDKIGSSEGSDTGTNGPCAGCHMGGPESHVFMPVGKDESGNIIEITANENVCSHCHEDTYALTAAILEEEAAGFESALDALEAVLGSNGFVFLGGSPYFSNTNWITASDPTGKLNMGAAFNFNLMTHDPGAYAHNRFYAKRLILDSIDWMDNGSLDGTIDLAAYPEAADWYQDDGETSNDNTVARP